MNKKLIRCLCYLIFTLLTVSVGRVKALKDKDSEQPFTIFLDAGNEIRNVVNSLASYGRKQDGMEEILKSAQNVMEKMEERLMELESTVKAAANVEKIVEPCRKLLEIRLGDIENKLNAMESIQRKNHALIEQRLDELGLNLRSTLRQQGEEANFKLEDKCHKTNCPQPGVYRDCAEAKQQLGSYYNDGIFEISLPNFQPFNVYCRSECTTCCPWTLVMRGSERSTENIYHRSWLDYEHGFGSASKDYFIGLDRLYVLTKQVPQALLVRDYAVGTENIFKEFGITDERYDYAVDNLVSLMMPSWGYNVMSNGKGDTFSSNSVCSNVRGRSWWYNQECVASFGTDSFSENIIMAIRPKACQEN